MQSACSDVGCLNRKPENDSCAQNVIYIQPLSISGFKLPSKRPSSQWELGTRPRYVIYSSDLSNDNDDDGLGEIRERDEADNILNNKTTEDNSSMKAVQEKEGNEVTLRRSSRLVAKSSLHAPSEQDFGENNRESTLQEPNSDSSEYLTIASSMELKKVKPSISYLYNSKAVKSNSKKKKKSQSQQQDFSIQGLQSLGPLEPDEGERPQQQDFSIQRLQNLGSFVESSSKLIKSRSKKKKKKNLPWTFQIQGLQSLGPLEPDEGEENQPPKVVCL